MTSRTAKLIYQSAFLAIAVIGIFASLGFFEYNYRRDFYVYFTNLSNYLCIGIMAAEFIQTIKNKEDGYVTVSPALKFAAVLAILLTFFVFNFILADYYYGDNPAKKYEISSILFHIVLPLMFTLDWILFYERGKVKWTYPLFAVLFPLLYGAFIYIRAATPGIETWTSVIYPYFFMNIKSFGVETVAKWIAIMMMVYVASGYILYMTDKIIFKIQFNINMKRRTDK